MASIVNIGRRIELVPIDPHFHDITIALYRQQREARTVFRVHTYSSVAGADTRIQRRAPGDANLRRDAGNAGGTAPFSLWCRA